MKDKRFKCEVPNCTAKFTRSTNLKKHIKVKHENISLSFSCYLCRKNFKQQEKYLHHIKKHKEGLSFVLYKQAFTDTIQVFRKHYNELSTLNDIMSLKVQNDILQLFESQMLTYPKYKVNILVQAEYILKGMDNVTTEKEIFNLKSSNFIISKTVSRKSLKKLIYKTLFEILDREKDMNLPQSGWISNRIILIDITFHKLNLLL